jgi:hypothetical protein
MKKRRPGGRTLPERLFERSPRAIAARLKHGHAFGSALSLLDGVLQRGGLSTERRDRLEEARIELIALFARTPEGPEQKRPRKRRAASRKA